jgi:2-dehydropantoate 2-reductase
MRILVVGTGVIGTIYGWALSGGGNDVVHLVRPGRATEGAAGIAVDILDHRKGHPKRFVGTYRATVTDRFPSPGQPPGVDLVVVPTKPYQVLEALRATVPATAGAGHLLLTQNWCGVADIEQLLPRRQYIYGDAQAGGTFLDGTLVAAIYPPRIVVGCVNGGRSDVLDRTARAFRDVGITPRIPANILHAIWVQYAINAGLWPAVVRAGGIRPLLGDRRTATLALKAVDECLDVVAARNVELAEFPEARLYCHAEFLKRQVAGLALQWLFRFNKSVQRTSAHVLADAHEIAEAYHALTTTGRELGIDMPVMASFEHDIAQFTAPAP